MQSLLGLDKGEQILEGCSGTVLIIPNGEGWSSVSKSVQQQSTEYSVRCCIFIHFSVSDKAPILGVFGTVHTLSNDAAAAATDKCPVGDWTTVPSLAPPQQMSNHPNITAGTEQHSG